MRIQAWGLGGLVVGCTALIGCGDDSGDGNEIDAAIATIDAMVVIDAMATPDASVPDASLPDAGPPDAMPPAVALVDCAGATIAQELTIIDNVFEQPAVQITLGETLRWTNNGAQIHTVTSGTPGDADVGMVFDSPLLNATEAVCFRFDEAAVYTYYCKTHPGPMQGATVTVVVPD